MDIFEYNHNSQSLEIFPEKIFSDPLIVFHGTCSYHSNNIENNGLIVNTAPYNIEQVMILVDLLKSEDFSKYDIKKVFFNSTVAEGIEHYLDSIITKNFRLSFSCLSSECVSFSFSDKKGGQAFHEIREAKQIIESAIIENDSLKKTIPTEIINLFDELKKIDSSDGVVYAIKLPQKLDGITCENNVIYSTKSIPVENIIGKLIIPNNPAELHIERSRFTSMIQNKLFKGGGINQILWRYQKLDEIE